MISRFVTTEKHLLNTICKYANRNILPILDYAVEHNNGVKAVNHYVDKKMALLSVYPCLHHSLKLSSIGFCHDSLIKIMRTAKKHGCTVLIDAEEAEHHKLVQSLSHSMIANGYDKQIYTTYQMYRKDGMYELLTDIVDFRECNMVHNIKLVRGAYLYRDGITGELHLNKKDTDEAYNEAIKILLKASQNKEDKMNVIFATHNKQSVQMIKDVSAPNLKYAFLMGMEADIPDMKIKQMVHIPFGPIHKTLPYLSRRYIENNPMLDKLVSKLPVCPRKMNNTYA